MDLYAWKYMPSKTNYIESEPYYAADKVIDDYISLIWCEREQKPGEFELVMDATPERLAYFKENKNMVISRSDSDRAMIVESINLKTNSRTGDILRIRGKSLESLFEWRTIIQTYTSVGAADDVIYRYIRENIGNYWYYNTDAEHLANLKMRYINLLGIDDYASLGLEEIEVQPFGQNLGDFVSSMCRSFGIGYKVRFSNGRMYYSLYRGADLRINQVVNNPVIFSADFDNIGNTDFTIDRRTYFSNIIVAGEGEGKDRLIAETGMAVTHGGIEIREKYLDKKNVSSNSDGASNYGKLIANIANTALDASKETVEFIGEALNGGHFRYRKDYDLGDTVTVQNPYGITGSAVVSEVVETVDSVGYKLIPTFTEWRSDENA